MAYRNIRNSIILLGVLALCPACSKPVEYSRTLGLFSRYNVLSSAGGSTEVPVFSNTDWTVSFQEPASWASIDRLCGSGSSYVNFDYEANFGRSRRVVLVFSAAGDTLYQDMFQSAGIADDDVVINMEKTSIDVPAQGADTSLAFRTNLIYSLDEFYLDITYPKGQEPGEPWVHLDKASGDAILLHFDSIDSVGTRIANVRVAHTDAGASYNSEEGTTLTSDVLYVTQTKEAE